MKKMIDYLLIAAMIAIIGFCIFKGLYYREQIKILEESRTENHILSTS